ncbi:hypothetical protein SOVF_202290 [Spinacia oleracea]|nr:hypothetical protein SOVF_202290 [Spinacia oleracea]
MFSPSLRLLLFQFARDKADIPRFQSDSLLFSLHLLASELET